MSKAGAIKRVMKLGKPSSVINGPTNSVNPTSLKKLNEAYKDLTKATSQPLLNNPEEPVLQYPNIDKKYKKMGEDLGICPYELRDIMNGSFSNDQTLVMTLLKKFVTAVKLSGAVDLAPTHKRLKDAETSYKNNYEGWLAACRKVTNVNIKRRDEIAQKQNEFNTAWGDILIDLVTKLSRNRDIRDLGEWDRLVVLAIASTDVKYCKINTFLADLNFSECKNMPADHVICLPKLARQIKESEEEEVWQNWLVNASLNDLREKLYEFDTQSDRYDPSRYSDLEWAISKKIGTKPVIDRYGNLIREVIFTDDDDDEDYDGLDGWGLG